MSRAGRHADTLTYRKHTLQGAREATRQESNHQGYVYVLVGVVIMCLCQARNSGPAGITEVVLVRVLRSARVTLRLRFARSLARQYTVLAREFVEVEA